MNRIEELEAALRDSLDIIVNLADQQAMPDGWWMPMWKNLHKILDNR